MRLWGALPLTTCQDAAGGDGVGLQVGGGGAGLQRRTHTQVSVWKTLLVLRVQQGNWDWGGLGVGAGGAGGAAGAGEAPRRPGEQAQWRVICEEDRGRGRGSEALVLRRPRGSSQPGLESSPPPTSHLGHAGGVSAFERIFLLQRPHQAGAAVGEGHEAVLAVVAAHAAVPCGTGGDGTGAQARRQHPDPPGWPVPGRPLVSTPGTTQGAPRMSGVPAMAPEGVPPWPGASLRASVTQATGDLQGPLGCQGQCG